MRVINFSDGREEIKINGKSVFLRLADPNIYMRAQKAQSAIEKLLERFDEVPQSSEEIADFLEAIDKALKEEINVIFDYDVSSVLFGGCSPLTPVDKDGTPYVKALIDHLMPIINEELNKSAKTSEAKISKYTAKYQK